MLQTGMNGVNGFRITIKKKRRSGSFTIRDIPANPEYLMMMQLKKPYAMDGLTV